MGGRSGAARREIPRLRSCHRRPQGDSACIGFTAEKCATVISNRRNREGGWAGGAVEHEEKSPAYGAVVVGRKGIPRASDSPPESVQLSFRIGGTAGADGREERWSTKRNLRLRSRRRSSQGDSACIGFTAGKCATVISNRRNRGGGWAGGAVEHEEKSPAYGASSPIGRGFLAHRRPARSE
jgi:hypothetical protein